MWVWPLALQSPGCTGVASIFHQLAPSLSGSSLLMSKAEAQQLVACPAQALCLEVSEDFGSEEESGKLPWCPGLSGDCTWQGLRPLRLELRRVPSCMAQKPVGCCSNVLERQSGVDTLGTAVTTWFHRLARCMGPEHLRGHSVPAAARRPALSKLGGQQSGPAVAQRPPVLVETRVDFPEGSLGNVPEHGRQEGRWTPGARASPEHAAGQERTVLGQTPAGSGSPAE